MKRLIGLLCGLVCYCSLYAQSGDTWYAAAKSGLSIREKPDLKAKVVEKLPYGEKVTFVEGPADSTILIVMEALTGTWARVAYKGKTGYVVTNYLLPAPPPKPNVKTLAAYLKQLSPVAGPPVKKSQPEKMGEMEYNTSLTKQLYKNGAEVHQFYAYEYNSDTYFLPDFTIEQGFLLLRLLGEYSTVIGPEEVLPQKSTKKKMKDDECIITVEKEPYGEPVRVTKRLRYEWQEGASYTLEMFLLDGQLVVVASGGV